ncbi:MAG TPA: hypothetical protein VGB36_14115 [Gammaproteobacteria bacterium]
MERMIPFGFFVAASALCLVVYSGDDVTDHAMTATTLAVEPPLLIPAGVTVHTVIVTPGPEGNSVEFTGSVSDAATSTMDCNNLPDSIYCNTAGAKLFGLSGDSATARWSDDIVTVANAGCLLDRFVIRVTGDRSQDTPANELTGYTGNYAHYQTCPGAEFSRSWPRTRASMHPCNSTCGRWKRISWPCRGRCRAGM